MVTSTWFGDGSERKFLIDGEKSADNGGKKPVVPLITDVDRGLDSAPRSTTMGEGISMMNQPKLPLTLSRLSKANLPCGALTSERMGMRNGHALKVVRMIE